jgi:hypothetical protein
LLEIAAKSTTEISTEAKHLQVKQQKNGTVKNP